MSCGLWAVGLSRAIFRNDETLTTRLELAGALDFPVIASRIALLRCFFACWQGILYVLYVL